MELRTYWRMLARRWWLVLAPVVIVGIYVVLTYHPPQSSYQVVIRFATGTSPSGLSEDYDRFYSWRTSEYIAGGLADVAKSGAFAEAIAGRLHTTHPDLEAATVRGGIATDYTRSILVVYLNYGDPALATAIAEAIAEEVATNAAAYFPQVEGIQPAARLLDEPAPAEVIAGRLQQLLDPAVQLALAACVGVALALLWHYLDPTVQGASDLEELGLGVIAEIPRG
jgi:capsular polysaccharide biosynthesis protein